MKLSYLSGGYVILHRARKRRDSLRALELCAAHFDKLLATTDRCDSFVRQPVLIYLSYYGKIKPVLFFFGLKNQLLASGDYIVFIETRTLLWRDCDSFTLAGCFRRKGLKHPAELTDNYGYSH